MRQLSADFAQMVRSRRRLVGFTQCRWEDPQMLWHSRELQAQTSGGYTVVPWRPLAVRTTVLVCGILLFGCLRVSAFQPHKHSDVDDNWSSAFFGTLLMIVCSELGDKTFLITAILSMRCSNNDSTNRGGTNGENYRGPKGSRWHVFAGGFVALTVMTLIAAAGGRVLPLLLKHELRVMFMVTLLIVFGIKMLHEAAVFKENQEEPEELRELARKDDVDTMESVDRHRLILLAHHFLSPVFIQAASLTFMAEWGDRSQLATFALAADQSASAVCLGATLGHGLCTALAVAGGRVLAKRISERFVLVLGGICFLFFAALAMFSELYAPDRIQS